MSEGEQKLLETTGEFLYAVNGGERLDSPRWRSCQIVLTNQRLVLSTESGNQAAPHTNITVMDRERLESNGFLPEDVSIGSASPFKIGTSVIVVDASGHDDFASTYARTILQDQVVLAKYPAVVGGVVQPNASWSKVRFRLSDGQITLSYPGEQPVKFCLDDVGTVESDARSVLGEHRPVVQVEHTDEDDQSVETHFSGTKGHTAALSKLFGQAVESSDGEQALTETEKQVLMALYSGVSPFEMAEFVGASVDEVEEIYNKLLDLGAVDKIRKRTEVALNAQGRNLASEAMSEE